MEIPAWLFFSFWAVISITFLHLGFYALDKTELSNSVSPVVMSVFKHSLAISSCCSSTSALILRPRSTDLIPTLHWFKIFVRGFYAKVLDLKNSFFAGLLYFVSSRILWGVLLFILITTVMFNPIDSVILWLIPILALINFVEIIFTANLTPQQRTSIGIHMAIETSIFFINNETTKFFPILVLFLSVSISMFRIALFLLEPYIRVVSGDKSSFTGLISLATKLKDTLSILKEKKMLLKLIAFGVGTLGSLLFQHFFKLTSFNHVIAFLSLAVMWLANLALLGISSDFGVFDFLLGNVVVGCTVNQFGLQRTTWLAYGASLLLFGLRLKLESLNVVPRGGPQHIKVMLWSESS